ncbi:hypothetical protein Pogu_ECE006 (plasmid) [Pyrobaculum oguniense TE7]|uniref:Uncharacterized protein n=1 Tax=Pyrobaculum oguniense (strain DSM 13380 / JCM 10595 / TE7) TaxID=698757 RepID=H6QE03_PYROT|nr:hypothetical protein Pogu_ECE006 [Pyrobaculum oguniense TE7]
MGQNSKIPKKQKCYVLPNEISNYIEAKKEELHAKGLRNPRSSKVVELMIRYVMEQDTNFTTWAIGKIQQQQEGHD